MGLRTFGSNVRMDTLKGEFIALRYLGEREVTSTPAWNNGKELTQSVARAEVVQFDQPKGKALVARKLGETLVFQRAIANDIRGSSDWAYGVFEEVERPTEEVPDRTMYELTEPDVSVEDIVSAFTTAGIAI